MADNSNIHSTNNVDVVGKTRGFRVLMTKIQSTKRGPGIHTANKCRKEDTHAQTFSVLLVVYIMSAGKQFNENCRVVNFYRLPQYINESQNILFFTVVYCIHILMKLIISECMCIRGN